MRQGSKPIRKARCGAKFAWILILWICLQPVPTLACRYNVRDVGFVDLGVEPYTLFCYVRDATPAELASQFTETARPALRDCNIETQVVNLDRQQSHPARQHLAQPWPGSFPAAVLVSPDGQALPVATSRAGEPFQRTLPAALNEIVSSPTRDAILRMVSQTFGAVLLIESANAAENSRARQTILTTLERFRAQMTSLPKVIAQPPAMIVIETAALAREKVLLWALGLGPTSPGEPRAAVIYGQARWIGPLMKGGEITERNLTGILSLIGADCECDLDIAWTQGTRLPVRWTEALRARTAKDLGFDPENPMVKVEVSRILGRSGLAGRAALSNPESAQAAGAASRARSMPAPGATHKVAPASPVRGQAAAAGGLAGDAPVLRRSVLVIAGLAMVIGVLGALIILRAARRRRLE